MARLNSCNVLQSAGSQRQLWQFSAQGAFPLKQEHAAADNAPLPAHLAEKSWPQLWQPRLNVAWLPAEHVFFRVVHLPASTFAETLSMVELQLEKLSPIPVGQAIWSVFPLPQPANASANDLQTLVVVFVERRIVEEFLGSLEGAGYLADRLELKALDQITASTIDCDGAWIYPGLNGGPDRGLVAWWYGGKLQSLSPILLPTNGDRAESLKEQLAQMAWAGELEGWLTALPQWTLVADDEGVAQWETPLRQGLDAPIRLSKPLSAVDLAGLTAKRAAQSDGKGNIIPPEYAARYRNQFRDRLWIRGAVFIGLVYLFVSAVFIGVVSFRDYRVAKIESHVENLGPTYTNALQLRERFQILKTREDLKFAALDCWKVTAEMLPQTLTLDNFSFSDGRRLRLSGTAPGDAAMDVTTFYRDILKAKAASGQPLFDYTKGQPLSSQAGVNGTVNWNFTLELKRAEGE